MQLPETKIYQACASDKDRPVLTGVHYNAEAQRLEAADGFILAVCPVSANGEPSGIIPADAIKAAYKAGRGRDNAPALTIDEGQVKTGRVTDNEAVYDGPTYPLIEGRFPEVDVIVPPEESLRFLCAINADLLKKLAEAICDGKYKHVALYQAPASDGLTAWTPIVVRPTVPSGNYGCIMPVQTNNGH